jgi:hypothetical protein
VKGALSRPPDEGQRLTESGTQKGKRVTQRGYVRDVCSVLSKRDMRPIVSVTKNAPSESDERSRFQDLSLREPDPKKLNAKNGKKKKDRKDEMKPPIH